MINTTSVFDKHNIGFDKHDIGFDKHDIGFDKHDIGFDKHDIDFDKHDIGFDKHDIGFVILLVMVNRGWSPPPPPPPHLPDLLLFPDLKTIHTERLFIGEKIVLRKLIPSKNIGEYY